MTVPADLVAARRDFARRHDPPGTPPGVRESTETIGGVGSLVLDPEQPGDRAQCCVLVLHSGGFVLGSGRSQLTVGGDLARSLPARVVLPDYRLAPEHPHPAAVQDAQTVYRELCDRYPGRVAVVGASAGGALAVTTALAAREQGLPAPAALGLLSPWVDLTLSGASIVERAGRDVVSPERLVAQAAAYCPADRRDPSASPLFADPTGLPPLLVQVGTEEVLHDDARRLVDAARRAGVPATLDVADGMGHVFQDDPHGVEAARGRGRLTAFLGRHLGVEPVGCEVSPTGTRSVWSPNTLMT